MSFRIALNFEDGVTRFIGCEEGETVLDAAYRQKVNLPMDCSDGVCGTCKGLCEKGEFDLGDEYLEEALSEEESAEGQVLTCQMVPSSDCIIQVPVASTMCKTAAGRLEGTVAIAEPLSKDSIELGVDLDDEAALAFLPGQYIHIDVPDTEEHRSYSFSSKPGNRRATFLIRNIPNGVMSSYLTDRAEVGDRLTLTGPMGSFYLRDIIRPVLMLAGGTGLAPFLSMLERLVQKKTEGETNEHPIHLIYGVNKDDHLVKVDALEHFANELDNFTYATVVVDEASAHPRKGYVTHHMNAAVLNDGDIDVYLCGPPPMVDAVLKYFDEQGIIPQNFYYEKFTPNQAAESAA